MRRPGSLTLLTLGKPADMVRWIVDRKGIPRAGIAQEADGETGVYWRASEDSRVAQARALQAPRCDDHARGLRR